MKTSKTFPFFKTIFLFVLFNSTCILNAQKNYFQQDVDYKIQVKLNDSLHELSAFEEIIYSNNSPDTLKFIYFHLWPNAYINNNTALAKQLVENGETNMYFAKKSELGYIDSLEFKVNDKPVIWSYYSIHIDICTLFLNEPLPPGGSIKISTPFHVKLPSASFSRLGHIGQAYMITQWYPKPAVYDNNGWNQMPYLDQGEFYSEFGSFDVSISLPKNYLLAATGDRIGDVTEEVNFLNEKISETQDKINKYKKGGDIAFVSDMSFPKSSKEYKTISFKQTNVHDFAWFADKRFNVLKGEVNLPESERKVETWSFFTNKNLPLWKNSLEYIADATYYYSLWNGNYQYNHVTAVDGTISAGGGMEYPNITVIGDVNNLFSLETVIMHEVGHNWFYGMLGSNERVNAWMDEGINSFNELRYIQTKYPNQTLTSILGKDSSFSLGGLNKFKQKAQYELFYTEMAKQHLDQPCSMHSADFTGSNYGAIVYSKTAVLFNYLMNYMGQEQFDKAMHEYFSLFKFKHPQPDDLKVILQKYCAKNLDWFFIDLIKTTKHLDYKIKRVKKTADNQFNITIKNKGQISGPIALSALKDNQMKAMIWLDGFKGKQTINYPVLDVDEFKIDALHFMPETNRKNNTSSVKGIIKKTEPIKLPFFASLDDPYQNQIYWMPLVGYNNYNGFMAGISIYNHLFFNKKMEVELSPLYDFKNKTIAGYSNLKFNLFFNCVFRKVTFGVQSARFAYDDSPQLLHYNKIAPFVLAELKKRDLRSSVNQYIKFRTVMLFNDVIKYQTSSNNTDYFPTKVVQENQLHELTYILKNKRTIHPFDFNVTSQFIEDVTKVSATFNYFHTISKGKKAQIRLFAGKFFGSTLSGDYRFRMSGQSGFQDYTFDNFYFGRSAVVPNIAAQQFTETDGAFKVNTPLGQSDDWIISCNIKTPKVFKLPFYVYTDVGIYNSIGLKTPELLYSAGVCLPIIKDIAEIYFPVLNSQNIKDNQKLNNINRYVDQIRFTFYLQRANPFEILKNTLPF